ncbi:MAG: DUF359 domain-containing protein [Candidatus Micrarchaeota archaeon]
MNDYVLINSSIRKELKRPFGKVYADLQEIKIISKRYKIISVGDISTLALLALGVKPYVGVFDLKYMRRDLPKIYVDVMKKSFGKMVKYKNPAGTLSKKLINDAKELLKHHCGVLIEGEEDITALAFMNQMPKNYVLVYGQPHKGIVLVKNDQKTRKRVERIFKKLKI